MRMSCNGCRVLRKGCSEGCSIRPCLQWIKSSDSQANATLFLAKFYGRAGLLNLIDSGPEHLRPAIFRSLLYEACGRVINPVYGSIGMLWSGNWAQCQAAVEAVLKGSPITQTLPPPPPASSSANDQLLSQQQQQQPISPLKTYDIRHVSRDPNPAANAVAAVKNRTRFKRTVKRSTTQQAQVQSPSCVSKEDESMFSVETVEGSLAMSQISQMPATTFPKVANGSQAEQSNDAAVGLELTLALPPY